MAIVTVSSGSEISLQEYSVGATTGTCIYPGIAQCFAIAGWGPNTLVCTHVSPGFTKQDMDDAFGVMKTLGGDYVNYWYIVGPFVDHFAVAKAQWRRTKSIKKTFTDSFNNKNAKYLILDATEERHTPRMYPGTTIMSSFSSIDVRITRNLISAEFAYKERRRDVTDWTEFDLGKFRRL